MGSLDLPRSLDMETRKFTELPGFWSLRERRVVPRRGNVSALFLEPIAQDSGTQYDFAWSFFWLIFFCCSDTENRNSCFESL